MNARHDMIACYVVRMIDGLPQFLQLLRRPGIFMGETWQNLSGGIEAREPAWRAALRELREETGLTPTDFYVVEKINTFYIHSTDTLWHCTQFCAFVPRDAGVVLNDENTDHRWVPRAEIDTAFMWPGERETIAIIL